MSANITSSSMKRLSRMSGQLRGIAWTTENGGDEIAIAPRVAAARQAASILCRISNDKVINFVSESGTHRSQGQEHQQVMEVVEALDRTRH